jgi:hypothetical protein
MGCHVMRSVVVVVAAVVAGVRRVGISVGILLLLWVVLLVANRGSTATATVAHVHVHDECVWMR